MSGKTRKLLLRICAFAVVIFMLAGEIKVPVYAEEIDLAEEIAVEEEGEIDLVDDTLAMEESDDVALMDGEVAATGFSIDDFSFKLYEKPWVDECNGDYDPQNDDSLDARTIPVNPTFSPEGSTGTVIPISSSFEDVIYIKDGKLIAKGSGTSTVTFSMSVEGSDPVTKDVNISVIGPQNYNYCANPGDGFAVRFCPIDAEVTWTSLNTNLVTVDALGNVTVANSVDESITGDGLNTKIKATYNGEEYFINFHVRIPVTKIESKYQHGIMWLGGTWQPSLDDLIEFTPKNATEEYKGIVLSSKYTDVVKVENGRVLKALKPGVVPIKFNALTENGAINEDIYTTDYISVVGVYQGEDLLETDNGWKEWADPGYVNNEDNKKLYYHISLDKLNGQTSTKLTFSDTENTYTPHYGSTNYSAENATTTYEDEFITVDAQGNITVKDDVNFNACTILDVGIKGYGDAGQLGYHIKIDINAEPEVKPTSFAVPKTILLDNNSDEDVNHGLDLHSLVYKPANANTDIDIDVESDNEGVVGVNEWGRIFAKGLGTANVKVTDQKTHKQGTVKVTVLQITPGENKLEPGETVQLKLTDGTDAKYKATWKNVDNISAARVDANGLVTAIHSGSSDNYTQITATYGGKDFVAGVKVLTPIESITATAHNKIFEVWGDDGRNHGWAENSDNISVVTYPAGLARMGQMNQMMPNPQSIDDYKDAHGGSEEGYEAEVVNPDYDEYANTSFDLDFAETANNAALDLTGKDPWKYLSVDPWGHVEAYYDDSLEELKKVDLKVTITTTTYDMHDWKENPETHEWQEYKTEIGSAACELIFTVALNDCTETHLDWQKKRISIIKGVYDKVGDIPLPEDIKNDGWEWLYPDVPVSKYEKLDWANIPVGIVNKNTDEVMWQDCMDVQFIYPNLRVDYDYGSLMDKIAYIEDADLRANLDQTGVAMIIQPDGNFWDVYHVTPYQEWNDVGDPIDHDPEYELIISGIDVNNVLVKDAEYKWYGSWDELNEARETGIKRIRAKAAGVGNITIRYTVKERDQYDEHNELAHEGEIIVEDFEQEVEVTAIDAKAGLFNWQPGIYRINNTDPKNPKINLSENGLKCWYDAVDENDWWEVDDDWTHHLQKGEKYAVVVRQFNGSNFKVTYKSTDAAVLTVGKNDTKVKVYDYEGEGDDRVEKEIDEKYEVIPITAKNIGLAAVSIQADDAMKTLDLLNVQVDCGIENELPVINSKTFTINKALKDEFQVTELLIKRSFGNEFIKAFLDNDSEHPLDTYYGDPNAIQMKGSAGKHVLNLVYLKYGGDPEKRDDLVYFNYNITIKEVNKAPAVKVKQTNNLNTTYKNIKDRFNMGNLAGMFSISTGGEPITGISVWDAAGTPMIEGSGDFGQDDPFGDFQFDRDKGYIYLYKNPGKFMTVYVDFDQYKNDVNVKVNVKTEAKTFKLSATTGTIVTDSKRDNEGRYTGEFNPWDVRLPIQIIDSKTKKAVDLNDFEDRDGYRVEINPEIKSGKMTNAYYTEISGDRRGIILRADEHNTAPDAKGDVIEITVKRPEWQTVQRFKYTIKGVQMAKATLAVGAKSLKLYNYIGMDNCAVGTSYSIKGGASPDMLNDVSVTQTVNAKKGETVILGKDIRADIDTQNGTIFFVKNSDNLKAGKYTFNLDLACPLWKKPQTAKITVEVIDVRLGTDEELKDVPAKNKIMTKMTSKGKIDVLDREGTSFVLTPTFSNIPADARIEYRGIEGPDSQMFQDFAVNNTAVTLKLDSNKRIRSTDTFDLQLKYYVDLGRGNGLNLVTPVFVVNNKIITQGKAKGVVSGNSVYLNTLRQEEHWLPFTMTNNAGNNLRIGYVNIEENAGFGGYYDGNDNVLKIRHEFRADSATNKSYTLKMDVFTEIGFIDVPVKMTYKVTLK